MKEIASMFSRSILAVVASAGIATAAHANLVVNGGFDSTTLTGSHEISPYSSPNTQGTPNYADAVTGWTSAGYNFLVFPNTIQTTGATSNQFNAQVTVWGPNNTGVSGSSANGFTDSKGGGNYIVSDAAYETGAISQTVNGLTVGGHYLLTFEWAAGQQYGFDGPTTDYWTATLGNQSYSTSTVSVANHGFSPWQTVSFEYVATATTETLSFLATGTPGGVPPFAMLDTVDLEVTVPEPGALAIVVVGLAGVLVASRRRPA